MKTKKYKAEVIETYPSEGRAAVRFSYNGHDRIECVRLYIGPSAFQLTVGMKGWASYHITPSMGIWGFEPFKSGVDPVKDST